MRAAWLALGLAWCGPAAAQVESVVVQGPQPDFGRFVGDLLTSTAVVTVAPGTVLDARSLPPVGPASPIADVRQVDVGGTPQRIAIRVTYQNFFAPGQVLRAAIPGYTLAFLANGTRLTVAVPGFGYTVSPFRHDLQPTLDPASMRPDHAAVPASAAGAAWTLAGGLALMAAGLAALIQPWPGTVRRRPFASAAARLARAARMENGDQGREAMLALHQAFDATAGSHVFADDLDDFLVRHQHLSPLRERIAAFFAASNGVFFGEEAAAGAAIWRALCRDLARAERLA